jgi:GNAT superfamily N-acetyltransferase
MNALWFDVWGLSSPRGFKSILAASLVHVGAYEDDRLVGFVNVATDGGIHAFLMDTTVATSHARRGIGTELVKQAVDLARQRGAEWLHVDFEPHLESFYKDCGFRPTQAGLIDLLARKSIP